MILPAGAGDLPPALDIQGVSHRFGAVEALRDVSFTVRPGSFCARPWTRSALIPPGPG